MTIESVLISSFLMSLIVSISGSPISVESGKKGELLFQFQPNQTTIVIQFNEFKAVLSNLTSNQGHQQLNSMKSPARVPLTPGMILIADLRAKSNITLLSSNSSTLLPVLARFANWNSSHLADKTRTVNFHQGTVAAPSTLVLNSTDLSKSINDNDITDEQRQKQRLFDWLHDLVFGPSGSQQQMSQSEQHQHFSEYHGSDHDHGHGHGHGEHSYSNMDYHDHEHDSHEYDMEDYNDGHGHPMSGSATSGLSVNPVVIVGGSGSMPGSASGYGYGSRPGTLIQDAIPGGIYPIQAQAKESRSHAEGRAKTYCINCD